jgi:hypothetical protein
MPVAAAALADVLVRHDHPPMALRSGDHPLDQAPVGLLRLRAPRELGLGVAQAQGEGVPDPLQLAGGEHPRPADSADAPLEPGAGEGRGEELAQPPVEIGYLPAQVVAGEPLGARGNRSAEDLGAGRCGCRGLVERAGHGGSFTRCLSAAF